MPEWDIAFRNLTVGYSGRPVLSDISASLPPGKITVIIGESGCGKSTLLRHIMGLRAPISGEILIGGKNLFALPRIEFKRLRRRMGALFQDGALLGSLNLAENAALPLSQHLRLPKKLLRQAALRVLEMVGLKDFADYYPNQLSGGMRKRAGLARAIIAEPLILLGDEPTSGLDPITAARLDDLLLSLHRKYESMTMVIVSHDLSSLKRIADYVLVLGEGKALFAGTLKELEASDSAYIKRFMNREAGPESLNFEDPINPKVAAALEAWFKS